MEPKAMKCIFVGYPLEKKGYKCYDLTTRQVYVSRDVKFCEHKPWYKPKPVMIEDEYEEKNNVRHVVDEPGPSTRTISGPHMTEESTGSVNPWSGRLRDKKQDEKGKKKVFEESFGDKSFDEEHGLPHLRTPGNKFLEVGGQSFRGVHFVEITLPSATMSSSAGEVRALLSSLRSAYTATPTKLKIIDLYVVYALCTAFIQVIYMAIVGSFPFNAFLSGFLSSVGTAVLAVCLRMQVNPKNKEFKELPLERAFADFVLANLVLHLVIMNFLG
ncbi:hypothetical protein L7F22_044350 [Adiantum nelumboides]|nr:hypothetical protein [Adiantum nelumboides]